MEWVGLRRKVCSDMACSLVASARSSPISSELVSMITAFSRADGQRRGGSSGPAVGGCWREEGKGCGQEVCGGCVDSLKERGFAILLVAMQLPILIINCCRLLIRKGL